MSASVAEDAPSPLSDGQSVVDPTVSKSPSRDSLDNSNKIQDEKGKEAETSPKVHPMAFTIDFGEGKQFDKSRLEELAQKSKARHQRIQSMSASLTRPAPVVTKPPVSAKLPRKAQGYNSEGYFSSDQEDCLSGSIKLKQSPLAQNVDRTHITSPNTHRNLKSPIVEPLLAKRVSKTPIVDSIMSRSDILPSRQSLNLPLKNTNSSYLRDVHRTPSYGNLASSYQPKSTMPDIISPEAVMLTDISSPELDILTPDNGLSTPEHGPRSPVIRKARAMSETPDMLFKKVIETTLFIDDEVDRESNNSSTGTYTIEGDNYTEEQKARMSIDRKFGSDMLTDTMKDTLKRQAAGESDPELVFDYPTAITKEPRKLRSPLLSQETFDIPTKVSKEKNVLEISCCYESPTDHDLAAQTSKQIKSTRNYLEKIKNRVRTITEKTFAKHEPEPDLGNFTSVTTSGVLSSKAPVKIEFHNRRRCSLAKSEIDQTDYVHRLSRESSVPISLSTTKPPFEDAKFESTALRNTLKALRDDCGDHAEISQDQVVGKLSNMSLNRCKGDKTWIQDWAESVKEYNNNSLSKEPVLTSVFVGDPDRNPLSPRWDVNKCGSRASLSSAATPTKIPSPVGTLHRRQTPDLIPATQDTESYLQKTQNAITNLQAKLHTSRNTPNAFNMAASLTSSLHTDKTVISRLPVSQLSRSNSLNYRLKRKTAEPGSPLRNPGNYVITGSGKVPESTRLLLNSASRSLDTDQKNDASLYSPSSDRPVALSNLNVKQHTRHKSFDSKEGNVCSDLRNSYSMQGLKTVNNNEKIDQSRNLGDKKAGHQRVYSDGIDKPLKILYTPCNVAFGSAMRRSSSFNTVRQNNNYIDSGRIMNPENSPDLRYKRPLVRDLKSVAPSNSPRCPNTPEMQRKFGPGLVRNSCRLTNEKRPLNSRMSEPPISREERSKPTNHHSRRVSEPRQVATNRLTKSRSSTREFQPKGQDKGHKPSQHRSSSALATKEVEFTNWKRRATYDPMRAAQEGKRKEKAKRNGCSKDDLSSPSHSSPVHYPNYSSDLEDDATMSSDHSPPPGRQTRDTQNHSTDTLKRQADADKRKTFILDDVTPTRDNVELFKDTIEKRKTFILDSDTNSTTNGSSPRNSSIFSHEKTSLTHASDTDNESGTESAEVVRRHPSGSGTANVNRYSGDYSMSSSTTSITQGKKNIQPRYLDISKYKNESSPKNFLRRDPSKTYVNVLPSHEGKVNKGSAQQYELEQKKQELEKWKRRASYDPRKAAAAAAAKKQPASASRND